MTVIPAGTKLLVKPLPKKEEKLDSSIIIPESANADLREGEVVAISNEISHLFKIGDIVLYPNRKGVGFVYNQIPHLWLDSNPTKEEIWGIVQ